MTKSASLAINDHNRDISFIKICPLASLLKSYKKLRIGTRGSVLALAQTQEVIDAISRVCQCGLNHRIETEIVKITTTGDSRQGTQDANIKDKKMWVSEIEEAIVRGAIDFAIHSSKDVPSDIDSETDLLPLLTREYPDDVFISRDSILEFETSNVSNNQNKAKIEYFSLHDLCPNASIGTASIRRKSQILHHRADVRIEELRGNINTRLQKLSTNKTLDGIILARVGLIRLGVNICYKIIPQSIMLPAVNQGIIVAQFKKSNKEIENVLREFVSHSLFAIWQAERQCVQELKADCHSAIGIFAKISTWQHSCSEIYNNAELKLTARILNQNGSEQIEATLVGDEDQSKELGISLAHMLNARGAQRLLHQ